MTGTTPPPIRISRPSRFNRCLALTLILAVAGIALGQFRRGGGRHPESVRTARDIGTRSIDTPMWDNPPGFGPDVFTFARLRYGSDFRTAGAGGGNWDTDLPDADLNLSYRLQQMTSLKVDPHARIIRANDPELPNYPFLMAAAAGAMVLEDD